MAPLIAGWIGWVISGSLRLGVHSRAPAEVPLTPRIIVTCLAVSIGIGLAVLILRTHLTVSDEGLADHGMFRVIRALAAHCRVRGRPARLALGRILRGRCLS